MIRHNVKSSKVIIDPAYNETELIASVKITYGDGEFIVDVKGNVAVLDIKYEGNILLDPQLNSEYYFKKSSRSILAVNTALETRSGLWFKYKGTLKILQCRASDWHSNTVNATIENNSLGYWGKVGSTWESSNVWETYKGKF